MADAPDVLNEAAPTPIAKLEPTAGISTAQVIDGTVTITWPHSIVTKSIAFILAERDVLLRRDKGQLRVEFHGAAGRAVADARIAGGDDIRLSLEGAEWTRPDGKTRLPGGSLDWQLTYSKRLLLAIQAGDSRQKQAINVNVPEDEPDNTSLLDSVHGRSPAVDLDSFNTSDALAEKTPPPPSTTAKRLASVTFNDGEYASPAFLKRARVSYGSLFDDGLDPFNEGSKKLKKKRSRFSMNNTTWRYSSKSPSPEVREASELEVSDEDEPVEQKHADAFGQNSTRQSTGQKSMVDEGSQTQELPSPSLPHFQAHSQAHQSNTSSALPVVTSFASETGPETPTRALFGELREQAVGAPSTFGAVQQSVGFGSSFGGPPSQLFVAPSVAEAAGTLASMPEAFPPFDFGSGAAIEQTFSQALEGDGSPFVMAESSAVANPLFGAPSQDNLPWHVQPAINTGAESSKTENNLQAAAETGGSQVQEGQPHQAQDTESMPANEAKESDAPQSDRGVDRENEDEDKDLEGDDYDLRNYDETRDDDEDESDEDREQRGTEADQGAIDLNEEGVEGNDERDDDEEEEEEEEEEELAFRRRGSDPHRHEEFAGSGEGSLGEEEYDEDTGEAGEAEEDYDEEGYDEDGYDEEEEVEYPSQPKTPQEPVFISLLSDSEDEGDQGKEETAPPAPEATHKVGGEPLGSEESEDQGKKETPQSEKQTSPSREDEEADGESEEESEVDGTNVNNLAAERAAGEDGQQLDAEESGGEGDEGEGKDSVEHPDDHEAPKLAEATQLQVEDGGHGHEARTDVEEEDVEMGDADSAKERPDETEELAGVTAKLPSGNDRHPPTPAKTQAAPVTRRAAGKQADEAKVAPNEKNTELDTPRSPETTQGLPHAPSSAALHTDQDEAEEAEESDPQITTRSLRSRTHRKTMSSDSTRSRKQDPSISLAQSQPQRSPSPAPYPPSSPRAHRVSRNRGNNADPSLALAQSQKQRPATPVESQPSLNLSKRATRSHSDRPNTDEMEAPSPDQRSISPPSSPRMLRAFRNRTQHTDPSLALAKAGDEGAHPNVTTRHMAEEEAEIRSQINDKGAEEAPHPNVTTRHMAEQEAEESTHPGEEAAEEPPHPNVTTRHMADLQQEEETPHPNVVTRGMEAAAEEEGHDDNAGNTQPPQSPTTRRSKRTATPQIQTKAASPEAPLVSPSIAGSHMEDESVSSLKRQLAKDLRTKLPDYLALRSLRTSLNKTADILAVCTSTPGAPYRPKNGPRDYMLEVALTDPSSAPTGVVIAHIFRPHQASLPVVQAGDVVLLRRMHVVSMKGRGFGVRVGDTSAWAVFEKAEEEMLPQIKGPPVEVLDEEVEYAVGLRQWWALLDDKTMSKVDKATQKLVQGEGK